MKTIAYMGVVSMSQSYREQILVNLLAAPIFVLVMSIVPEPYRQISNAALLGVAALLYLGHGLGAWEIALAGILLALSAIGLHSYAAIAIGWLVHTISDVIHHRMSRPMVSGIPLSSFGCAVFDPLIAIWFAIGAPTVALAIAR